MKKQGITVIGSNPIQSISSSGVNDTVADGPSYSPVRSASLNTP